MKPIYRITPRALNDLKNIGRYTLKKWGKTQRNRYLSELDQRLAWLAEHPDLGKNRPDIDKNYYCYPHKSHIVFYTKNEGGINIIGIPHQAMDIAQYFDIEDF
jgi:toxin ParE1/3/4